MDNDEESGTIINNTSADNTESGIRATNADTRLFRETLESSHNIIFRCKTIFPFVLFPDEVTIDENKIDVKRGLFFASHNTTSIPFKRVVKASTTTGLFFASLIIEMEIFVQQPDPINYLWKEDAIKARRIINGLAAAHKKGIDLSNVDLVNLSEELEDIGRASS